MGELCDRYLATVQHQKPKTIERKALIARRIKSDWPTGRLTQVAKVKPSHVDLWLSRYRFGPVSRNQHAAEIKRIFETAVRDGIKEYTGWPTIPQIFINGKFVGGRDIVAELAERGELETMIKAQ